MGRLLCYGCVVLGLAIALQGAGHAVTSWVEQRAASADVVMDAHVIRDGSIRGKLVFPSLGESRFVVEGASEDHLLRGPVRVTSSAEPGTDGNVIIAGHRDTHFRILRRLNIGDAIEVEEHGSTFKYRVSTTRVVDPADQRHMQPTERGVLTLITCYPFYFIGPAPSRFIVQAELIHD